MTLEFLEQNAGDPFSPTVVHDGNGCQDEKNVVFAIPGGWNDACWGASCSSNDNAYGVYAGFLGAYYSHFSNGCTMGGSTSAIVAPDAFDRYYLVVPNDGQNEGSYGRDSSDNERPPGGAACEAPQNIGCP